MFSLWKQIGAIKAALKSGEKNINHKELQGDEKRNFKIPFKTTPAKFPDAIVRQLMFFLNISNHILVKMFITSL